VSVEVRDVADGLWLWRQPHPSWVEGDDWEPAVASFVVESRGVVYALDPLAPPPSERAVWDRIEARPPDGVVVLKPDHVRDVDLFVRWYGARGAGAWLYRSGQAPHTKLAPLLPGDELPGGLLALDDGRGTMETPLYLPEQRALVFADGLIAQDGVLRVWASRTLEQRGLAALRALLDLPFERVLVSHGDPVHDRAEFEAALEREPHR
jgi:hypothetical protein